MNLSLNAQATILLTCYFSRPKKGETKPLTNTEWGKLASWLMENNLTPAAFIEEEVAKLLEDWNDSKITQERIIELLNRGHSFALAMEKWSRAGLWVITRSDVAYPKRLKARLKMQAPPVLFGCGNQGLLNAGGLAVVGSRKAVTDDLNFTSQIGQGAAVKGLPIVSGGAKGIDETSMTASLENGGFAVGVMADSLLKASSSAKWRKGLMDKRAVLISPFYPEAGFNVGNAMARNKYIYCLADAALVVHSGETGGTIAGAKENLKKQWVPMWVKHSDDPAAANSELVNLGGYPFDSSIRDLDFTELLNPIKNKNSFESTDAPEEVKKTNVESVKESTQKTTFVESANTSDQTHLFDIEIESLPSNNNQESQVQSVNKTELLGHIGLEVMSEDEHSDIFYTLFLNEVESLTIHSVSESYLLEHLNLHKSQLKEWLKRAVDDEKLKKFTRPVRYQNKKNKAI